MIIDKETPFQKAINVVESLSFDDREEFIDIIKRRLAEERRKEIAVNAREAIQAVREKRALFGTVNDLKKDLLNH